MAAENLVSIFAILLVLGSVLFLFGPLFFRLLKRGMWAMSVIAVIPAFVVASMGLSFVELSFSNPAILAPIVAFVFVARVVSPTLALHNVREKLASRGLWGSTRAFAFLGFLGFGLYVGYQTFVSPEGAAADPVLATERIVMAVGTSFIFLRLYYKAMPRESSSLMMVWLAAIFFSLAFSVVAPYAFPDYHVLYSISGVMGWLIGAAVIAKSP